MIRSMQELFKLIEPIDIEIECRTIIRKIINEYFKDFIIVSTLKHKWPEDICGEIRLNLIKYIGLIADNLFIELNLNSQYNYNFIQDLAKYIGKNNKFKEMIFATINPIIDKTLKENNININSVSQVYRLDDENLIGTNKTITFKEKDHFYILMANLNSGKIAHQHILIY